MKNFVARIKTILLNQRTKATQLVKGIKGLPKIEERITQTINVNEIPQKCCLNLQIILFETDPKKPTNIKNVTFRKCIFSKQVIHKTTFQDCHFDSCQFNGTIIVDSEFHQCKFTESSFYKANVSGAYIDPSSFVFSYKWYRNWANVNAGWYQSLYRNSKSTHQETFAMVADKKFQFYRRYDYLLGKKEIDFDFYKGCYMT